MVQTVISGKMPSAWKKHLVARTVLSLPAVPLIITQLSEASKHKTLCWHVL
jgi:hypothetical protein